MLFRESQECLRLYEKYGEAIRSEEITQRGLCRLEGLTRHKARELWEYANSFLDQEHEVIPENSLTPEERMSVFNKVAEETLRQYREDSPLTRQGLSVGGDSPGLIEVKGVQPNEEVDVSALVQRTMATFTRADEKQERRDSQRVVFSGGPIGLVFGGDEHFGGKGVNIERMLYEARLVNETPGLWHCRMGDMVNQFILGRMRAIRDSSAFTIKEEWVLAKMLIDLIEPKLLAVVGGNHDDWHRKAAGFDYLEEILPDGILYDKYEVVFDIHVGDVVKTVKMRHKWKGSSVFNPTHGIEVHNQRDMADADIFVAAHTHTAALVREFLAQRKRRLAVLVNTLKQYDDYPREMGFPRSDKSSSVAVVIIEETGEMFGAPTLEWAAQYMSMRHSG